MINNMILNIVYEDEEKVVIDCDCSNLTGESCHTCEKCGGEGIYIVYKDDINEEF